MAVWDRGEAQDIIARHAGEAGGTLPILHDLQAAFGHVPADAVPMVADALNLSRAEIHGVVSFYHDFRDHPAGRAVVALCRAEACQAMGAERIADQLRARLGVDWHGTTADGAVTLLPVFCLGLCACAPAALIDGEPVGRLTTQKLSAALGR